MYLRSILIALLSGAAILAQVDTGAVSGVVTDASGSVVPGARIRIMHEETNFQSEIETNESGFYSAPGLRVGRYVVLITKEAFRSQKSQEFELRVQDRVEMNFQLEVGATTSEITVSAAAPLLESETSSLGQVVEGKTIADLPLNGRSFIQLAILGAGALPSTRTAERDNFISNGARAV